MLAYEISLYVHGSVIGEMLEPSVKGLNPLQKSSPLEQAVTTCVARIKISIHSIDGYSQALRLSAWSDAAALGE